jgi:hypothetical protein
MHCKNLPFIIHKVCKHVLWASHQYKDLTLTLSTPPNSLEAGSGECFDELRILFFRLDSILADLVLREVGSFRDGTEDYDHVHTWRHRMSTEVHDPFKFELLQQGL